MKHILYETRQWNYWFLPVEIQTEARQYPWVYREIISNFARVLKTNINNISQELFFDLSSDTNKVKELMDNWILDRTLTREEQEEEDQRNYFLNR